MKTGDLSTFPLKWRWTSNPHNQLLPHELEQIKPLGQMIAIQMALKSETFYLNEIEFVEELYEAVEFINAHNFQETQKWLKEKMGSEEIIVSWDANNAVITNTQLFSQYWDAFCCSSYDNISIWPLNEKWVIRYFPSEKFGYARNVII